MKTGLNLGSGYRMTLKEAAATIGQNEADIRQSLRSNQLNALLGQAPEPQVMEVDDDRPGADPRVVAIGLDVVCAYWLDGVRNGNKKAIAMTTAMVMETMERRFDAGFKADRTESERNDRLSQRMEALGEALGGLDGYAWSDGQRDRIKALEAQIRSLGADPWQPPAIDE
jgi:hypothetical protein